MYSGFDLTAFAVYFDLIELCASLDENSCALNVKERASVCDGMPPHGQKSTKSDCLYVGNLCPFTSQQLLDGRKDLESYFS